MNDVTTRVRAMIASNLRVDIERVTDAARLTADLQADTLDIVDLVMDLEDRFQVIVTDKEMEAITTVADLISLARPAPMAEAA